MRNNLTKKNIINSIYMQIGFSKKIIDDRIPLLFFAIRSISYDSPRGLPSIVGNLTLHIQVYSNVNVLYKNLQIKLARKSWINVTGKILHHNTEKTSIIKKKPIKKLTKKEKKEMEKKQTISSLYKKTAYLDIIPKANNVF